MNGSGFQVAPTKAVLQPEYISNLGAFDNLFRATFFPRSRTARQAERNGSLHQVIQHPCLPARLLRSDGAFRGGQKASQWVKGFRRNQHASKSSV